MMMVTTVTMTTVTTVTMFSGSSVLLIVLVKGQDNGRLLEDSHIYAGF